MQRDPAEMEREIRWKETEVEKYAHHARALWNALIALKVGACWCEAGSTSGQAHTPECARTQVVVDAAKEALKR